MDPREPLTLPAPDACARGLCGEPAAAHGGSDGLFHPFEPPASVPDPSRCSDTHWETWWTCWSCGQDSEVWGVAGGEWMDCDHCGAACFLS